MVEFLAINCYETKWLDIVSGCLPSESGSLGNQEIGLLVFLTHFLAKGPEQLLLFASKDPLDVLIGTWNGDQKQTIKETERWWLVI